MNDSPVLREKGKHPRKERKERIPKKEFCNQKERIFFNRVFAAAGLGLS